MTILNQNGGVVENSNSGERVSACSESFGLVHKILDDQFMRLVNRFWDCGPRNSCLVQLKLVSVVDELCFLLEGPIDLTTPLK